MIIKPQIVTTPDCPTVMFREAEEAFDIEQELLKVLHRQGWGLGTRFNVHLVDHDITKLLATASYVVTEDIEDYQTRDVDGYQSMSKTVYRRKCARLGEWVRFDAIPGLDHLKGEDVDVIAPLDVKWNPGKKVFEVKAGDRIIASDPDKEKAQAIARGEAA